MWAVAYLLVIMGAVSSASEMATAARGVQATNTPMLAERISVTQPLGLPSHGLLARLPVQGFS